MTQIAIAALIEQVVDDELINDQALVNAIWYTIKKRCNSMQDVSMAKRALQSTAIEDRVGCILCQAVLDVDESDNYEE